MSGKRLAGAQILDVQRVLPEARGVGRVGQQVLIVADHERAQAHELVALARVRSDPAELLPALPCCPCGGTESGYCLPSSVRE